MRPAVEPLPWKFDRARRWLAAADRRSGNGGAARHAENRIRAASGISARASRTSRLATRAAAASIVPGTPQRRVRSGASTSPIRRSRSHFERQPNDDVAIRPWAERGRRDRVAVDRQGVADGDERQCRDDRPQRRPQAPSDRRAARRSSGGGSRRAHRGTPSRVVLATAWMVKRSAESPFNRPSASSEAGNEPRG